MRLWDCQCAVPGRARTKGNEPETANLEFGACSNPRKKGDATLQWIRRLTHVSFLLQLGHCHSNHARLRTKRRVASVRAMSTATKGPDPNAVNSRTTLRSPRYAIAGFSRLGNHAYRAAISLGSLG